MSVSRLRAAFAARLFPAGLALTLVGFGLYFDHAASVGVSPDARRVAEWAVATRDAAGLPFVVVDNAQARVYAFDPQGRSLGERVPQPSVAYVIERGHLTRSAP